MLPNQPLPPKSIILTPAVTGGWVVTTAQLADLGMPTHIDGAYTDLEDLIGALRRNFGPQPVTMGEAAPAPDVGEANAPASVQPSIADDMRWLEQWAKRRAAEHAALDGQAPPPEAPPPCNCADCIERRSTEESNAGDVIEIHLVRLPPFMRPVPKT